VFLHPSTHTHYIPTHTHHQRGFNTSALLISEIFMFVLQVKRRWCRKRSEEKKNKGSRHEEGG